MEYKKKKVLIVDDQKDYLKLIINELKSEFDICYSDSLYGLKNIILDKLDVALLDIRLNKDDSENTDGIEILKILHNERPDIPVIMMTAYGDVDIAVESMKFGAVDFIQKNKVEIADIRKIIQTNLEKYKLTRKISELEKKLQLLEPGEIVGDSDFIKNIRRLVDMVANDGYVTVLLQGATGTGKELVARAIHSKGVRNKNPFVAFSISSLNRSLVESELFGHEKGAFTGAGKRKIGYIEKANGGILFLDEIGELDPEIQMKLLRFLENKTFRRLGSTDDIQVDLQIIAATNKNLETAVREKNFRDDLYFRLKTFQIFLPELKERKKDIPQLAKYFLKLFHLQGRTRITTISNDAMELLKSYLWPGNIRELKSCIERAVIYAEYNEHKGIIVEDLPLDVRQGEVKELKGLQIEIQNGGTDIHKELRRLELAYIEKALEKVGGKKIEAWKILGYNDRYAMQRRIKRIIQSNNNLLYEFPLLQKLYKRCS